ncbi:hypothetical protein pkur_cds_119 [Pandoravirus kuranda]|uniref:Uncharacterized protein n=1 Tax=Pandoravirus kuranda TaxID=3019033 RepID=A0AA95J1Z2_9VIRU|nr:hypothetical protein pkur_cds_119 [Pandoravirus kuranda]
MTTTHGKDNRRESTDSGKRRHRGHRGGRAPSAALIDSAAYMRPLEVRLPACATNKIVLPPAPVTGRYKAMFEVEFANASPDTRIDLALAMRIDGCAILRNVQEVAANERQCVRLDMQTEAQKGQVPSLTWRPFSRDTERLPSWLTIMRAEARMHLVEPEPQAHAPQAVSTGSDVHAPFVQDDTTREVSDATAPCVPDNGVRGLSDAKTVGKDHRNHRRHRGDAEPHRRRRDKHRDERGRDHVQSRHKDNADGDIADGAARHNNNHKAEKRKSSERPHRHRSRRSERTDGEATKHETKRARDHVAKETGGGIHHQPRDAVVATALAAVAAARNAINNGNTDDDDYDDDDDSGAFVAPTSLPQPARMLVPITAVGRRGRHHY